MKGIVFTTFNEMIESELGIEAWENLLDQVQPASGGIYTSVVDYQDEELMTMVMTLSDQLDKPLPELVEHFGYYLFGTLAEKYPIFLKTAPDLFSFLDSIDGVIHKEVHKLYENPNLPSISTSRLDEQTLQMTYRSPRKLCHLAVGLVRGAAERYGSPVSLTHAVCMHEGADRCELQITLK